MPPSSYPIAAATGCSGRTIRCHPDSYDAYRHLCRLSGQGSFWAFWILKAIISVKHGNPPPSRDTSRTIIKKGDICVEKIAFSLPGIKATLEKSPVGQYVLTSLAFVAGSTASSLAKAFGSAKEHVQLVKAGRRESLLQNPTGNGIRNDNQGKGHFGAPRGGRAHKGIDLSTSKGQDLVAPVSGKATYFNGSTTGYPMVDIIPEGSRLEIDKVRILYVNRPDGVSEWDTRRVAAGDSLGTAANLQSLGYSQGVTPHIHLQILSKGDWINPEPYFTLPSIP